MGAELSMGRKLLFIVVLLTLATHITFQTIGRNSCGEYDSPIVWFVSGLLFSLSAWSLFRRPADFQHLQQTLFTNRYIALILGTAFLTLAIHYSFIHLDFHFKRYPVKLDGSDVIPTIQIMVRRFLAGEPVYDVIEFPYHKTTPTYFTFTWLPYVPAEVFKFDYRWTAVIAYLGTLIALIYSSWARTKNHVLWLVFCVFSSGIFYGLARYDNSAIRFGVEFMPACFYIILCLTIFSRNFLVVSLGILLCLLSRYSFALWLPFYALITWHQRGTKFALKVIAAVAFGGLVLFLLPFLDMNITKITDALAFYAKNAPGKWVAYSWQPEGSVPYLLKQGYGLAIHFYSGFENDIPAGINLIKKMQIISVVLVGLLTTAYYFINRNKNYDIKLLLLVSLNIYLLFFYGFLYAPYGYLFMLPLSGCIGILWWLTVRGDQVSQSPTSAVHGGKQVSN